LTRVLGFTLFITIGCAIVTGLHYYLWARLVRDPQLSGQARWMASATVIALGCLVVATPLLGRILPSLGRVLAWPGFLWMGMMFILAVILFGTDVLRFFGGLVSRWSGHDIVDPSRRAFAARVVAGTALTAMSGVTAAALQATRGSVAVKRVEVVLDRLPPAADGMRIVQLCDMHVGGLLGRSFVEQVVETTNQLAPDVVAIVGDLVDGTVEDLRPALASMASLRARHGAFFVTGNHEYYSASGPRGWTDEVERMGIRVLCNQRVPIGTADAGFDLAGVPDHSAGRFRNQGPAPNVALAMHDRDPARAVILLAHQPIAISEAALYGADLQLSGHTHGGQIWPWGMMVRLQQPFVRGLHRVRDTQIYVSCGTGFWGPPLRLGAPAEITEIVLRSKPKI
jgi:uncharacterized protein